MANIKLSVGQRRQLEREGFTISELEPGVLENQPKATFYTKDGRAMPNLPNDPISRRRYLARGFTLSPPAASEPSSGCFSP